MCFDDPMTRSPDGPIVPALNLALSDFPKNRYINLAQRFSSDN